MRCGLQMFLRICVLAYIQIYTHTYIDIYTYVHVCTYTYPRIRTYRHTCIDKYAYARVCICTYINIHTHTYTYIHVRTWDSALSLDYQWMTYECQCTINEWSMNVNALLMQWNMNAMSHQCQRTIKIDRALSYRCMTMHIDSTLSYIEQHTDTE